jgi:hypothetical protein
MKYIKTYENLVNKFPDGNLDELVNLISSYLKKFKIDFILEDLSQGILKYTIKLKNSIIYLYPHNKGWMMYNEVFKDETKQDVVANVNDMDGFTYYFAKSFGVDTGKVLLKMNK